MLNELTLRIIGAAAFAGLAGLCLILQRRGRSCPRHQRRYGAPGWIVAAAAMLGAIGVWVV